MRDVTVDEKSGTASFVVMLGGPSGQASNGTVTVDYSTANGSGPTGATAGSDYTATSGTLTFAAGETVKTVVVDITDDIANENFERFFLDLENASGANILDDRAVAIIGASDATAVSQPRISVSITAVTPPDGCSVRFRPTSPLLFASPCRKRSSGVGRAPPERTTARPRTRSRPRGVRASTPTARPPSRITRSTAARV